MKTIAKANEWLARLKAGETYADIAQSGKTAKTRVQQMIGLAFLAPDIVRSVVEGRQPLGL